MVVDLATSEFVASLCLGHLRRQIPEKRHAALRGKLIPSYAACCKRVLLSDTFFPALPGDNVTLETRPIECATAQGIQVDGVEHKFDALVLATGFRAQAFLSHVPITGVWGRTLEHIWEPHGPHAYYGVTVNSLPNIGMLYGPNTNLSHVSVLLVIEAQTR